MENEELKDTIAEEEQPVYTPRPKWQVWAARVAVVVLVVLIILYYITIARGGM